MCENTSLIAINYTLADGTIIQVDVTLEVAAALGESERKMLALFKQDNRHIALAYLEGVTEFHAHKRQEDVADIVERLERYKQLHLAINRLTHIQRRRIIAYFFEEASLEQIAKQERVSKISVFGSIQTGLKKLRKILRTP